MDTLDRVTLLLLVCLVAVALLFPLSTVRWPERKRPSQEQDD